MKKGRAGTMTHDYKRNGTTSFRSATAEGSLRLKIVAAGPRSTWNVMDRVYGPCGALAGYRPRSEAQ